MGHYSTIKRQKELDRRICARCHQPKSLSEFQRYQKNGHEFIRSYCSPCLSEYQKLFPAKPKTAKQRAQNVRMTTRRREKALKAGLCGRCHSKPKIGGITVCVDCAEKDSVRAKKYNDNCRKLCFDHYGRICKCCGEWREELLTMDHIGGWGKDHKMPSGKKYNGAALYRWIIKNNFPDTFQTLCFSCNCSRAHSGFCPHELEHTAHDTSYLGQDYFHEFNPNIRRAELNFASTIPTPKVEAGFDLRRTA